MPLFVLLLDGQREFLHSQLLIPISGNEFPDMIMEAHLGQGIFLSSISFFENTSSNSFLLFIQSSSVEFLSTIDRSKTIQSRKVNPV